MLKMLSVFSQIRLSHSGICSVIAFYLDSRRVPEACLADPPPPPGLPCRSPPILLKGSTGGGEALCDLRCAASLPVLTHVPLVVDALRISRRGNRKEKISGFSLRGSHMPSLISLSADLANSLQHVIKEGFVCVCVFVFVF